MSAETVPEAGEFRAICLDCEWQSRYTFRYAEVAADRAAIHNRMNHRESE